MRRTRRGPWVSLLLAAVLLPLTLGWLVYSFRSVEVACRRDGEAIRCSAIERVGSLEVWSAEVDDVRIARSMSGTGGGPQGVVVETQAGALVPLTSSVLGTDQHDAIAARVHQWIFVEREAEVLEFTQPPSLANAVLGGGIALLVLLWGLSALVGVTRAATRPRPASLKAPVRKS